MWLTGYIKKTTAKYETNLVTINQHNLLWSVVCNLSSIITYRDLLYENVSTMAIL